MGMAELIQAQLLKAEATIQAEVGEFLQLKSKLLPFTRSGDPAIKGKADALLARQIHIEGQMPGAMASIEAIKTDYDAQGLPSLIANSSKVKKAYNFAKDFKEYKSTADKFVASSGRANVDSVISGAGMMNAGLMATVALGGLAALYFLKGKR